MNRMEEYEALLSRLETVPFSDPVKQAKKRQKKRRVVVRSLGAAAAAFCIFVGTVNLSPTVSAACREIPLLKELVEILTFHPSLQIAVEHDYVQPVGQEQTKDGITGRIEHLIVDQKQVNIFFTLRSDGEACLDAVPDITGEDGAHVQAAIVFGGMPGEEDELRHITVDFMEEDVPDYLKLKLKVWDTGDRQREEALSAVPEEKPQEFLTELVFELRLDPEYTEQGKTVRLNQTVDLDGQEITVTDMEIYPTHIRINISEAEQNTAWLKSLHFYLETEDGQKIRTITNGISATGSPDTPSMVSYRAESSYFYDADCIRLCLTGADFLDKEREKFYVNFNTLESDPLPDGVKLWSAEKKAYGTELVLLIRNTEMSRSQVLGSTYYGLDGTEYHCGRWSCSSVFYDPFTDQEVLGWGDETYYLEGFQQDEAVFELGYTHFWIPETPVKIELTEQ